MCRAYSATPRLALAARPVLLAMARRNQRAFARKQRAQQG
jgi:hypothetical protein